MENAQSGIFLQLVLFCDIMVMRKQRRENICGMMAFATILRFFLFGSSHHPVFFDKFFGINLCVLSQIAGNQAIYQKINILTQIDKILPIF
jgi:hypothetical protein